MSDDDNVVPMHGTTKLDIPADRVIDGARDKDLDTIVVVGLDQDGELYFASSTADAGTVLILLERAKVRLLDMLE